MAKVNLVNKQVQLGIEEIIRFQIITHCYINRIILSELDADCLTFLGVVGEVELTDFCKHMAEKRLNKKLSVWKAKTHRPESSPQTIRNILIRAEKAKLVLKKGTGRKKISLSPDLKIQTVGNIMLNYKFICLEPQEA
jgi:hypothetical protein